MEKIYEESKDVHANYMVYANTNYLIFANKELTEYLDNDEFVRAFKSNEIVICLAPAEPTELGMFTKVLAVRGDGDGDVGVDCYCAVGANIQTFHIAEKEEESGSEDDES